MIETQFPPTPPATTPATPWQVLGHAVSGVEAQLRLRRSPRLGAVTLEDTIPERKETIARLKALPLAVRFIEVCRELADQEQSVAEFAAKLSRKEAAVEECVRAGGDLMAKTMARDGAQAELADVARYRDELHQAATSIHAELAREHQAAGNRLMAEIGGLAIADTKRLKAAIAAKIGDLLDQLARVEDRFSRGRNFALPPADEIFGRLPAKTELPVPALTA